MLPRVARVLDLTQPLYHDCPCATVLKAPEIRLITTVPREGYNTEGLVTNTHIGTHVDIDG